MHESNDKANGIYIPVDQIYMVLQETANKLAEIRSDTRALAEKADTTISTINDHESRLRSLEKWKYAIPLTAIAAVCSAITCIITSLLL